MFFGRNDAKAETPVLWPPHAKSWLIGKDPDAGRDWGQEEKGKTEDEMAGWHHWLDGCEFEWTPGVGDGQGGLAFCDLWSRKESDMTEWLNWTEPTVSKLSSVKLCESELHLAYLKGIILKVKYITVVRVQNGCKWISCLPSCSWVWLRAQLTVATKNHQRM